MRVKASNSKAKPAPAVEIQQIAKGVSGQTFGPSKQISLGKK